MVSNDVKRGKTRISPNTQWNALTLIYSEVKANANIVTIRKAADSAINRLLCTVVNWHTRQRVSVKYTSVRVAGI